MNCQEIEKFYLDYCDNNLSSELRGSFEDHLSQCANCRILVDLTCFENEALLDPVDIPVLAPDFNARLLDRIQTTGKLYPNRQSHSKFNKYLFNRPYIKRSWALMAAALLLVLLIPPILNQGLNNNSQPPAGNNSQQTLTLPRSDDTRIKASLEKTNDKALKQEIIQPQSDSAASKNTVADGDAGLQYKIPNQEIPLLVNESQKSIVGNASSRDVNQSRLSSRSAGNHKEGLNPYPENLPAGYELVQDNMSDGQYIYLYRESSSNNELNIVITPLNPQSTASSLGAGASEPLEATSTETSQNLAEDTAIQYPAANVTNSCNKNIFSDNISYSLTVSGNLPQESIESIASALTLTKK